MADISRRVKSPGKGNKVYPKTASFTAKVSESGQTFTFDSVTRIIATLPKITKANDGTEYTFTLKQLDGGVTGHTVTPATGDTIQLVSATVNQSLIFAVATDQVGQTVTLVADYATLSWFPSAAYGTFTKA